MQKLPSVSTLIESIICIYAGKFRYFRYIFISNCFLSGFIINKWYFPV
jgi:hypothetical protein